MSHAMDSIAVKGVLDALPDVPLADIDLALSWLAVERRNALSKWNADLYAKACEAIDCLLDARLEATAG